MVGIWRLDGNIDPLLHGSPKRNQSLIFIGRTDAQAPILWPPDAKNWLFGKDWCWERLKAGEEGDDRGWDGWMASLTQWTWVWVSSGSWWWTGRPGMLQSMGRKGSYTTEWLNWTEMIPCNHSGGQKKKQKQKRESGVQYRTWLLGIYSLRVDLWVRDKSTSRSEQTYRAPQNERIVHHSPSVSAFEARSAYKIM